MKIAFAEMNIFESLKIRRWEKGHWQYIYILLWRLYNVYRFITISSYRSRIIYSFRFKNHYHQFSNFTRSDRYPDLFKIAKKHFQDIEKPTILSFGCSTGEEVATLSEYIPHATIVGVDINKWCLKQATRNFHAPNRFFYHCFSQEFLEMNNFDAIFCLAVFQHPGNRHNSVQTESYYPFSHFEKKINELSEKLKPNGLFFIDHCDFNFLEVNIMKQYRIAPFLNNQCLRQRPLFNRDNKKTAMVQTNFRVFQKK
ncbi:class I SAM-dependent methyltransferase [Spirosoma sp. KCTC 42546]|uniref:class I SAM-dependent methyltransferase n=1 Tax=Spirosoma sp. KCTC 42546 TaxID=2520506 RepID=UPI001158E9F5|nr:class I SAM-dependent methyltransferase [Spirosoma sp. KCTC 42546]QDK82413.1 class I SAM-dependent methyltransferase [Spirosoma sp. KCTC 42546]